MVVRLQSLVVWSSHKASAKRETRKTAWLTWVTMVNRLESRESCARSTEQPDAKPVEFGRLNIPPPAAFHQNVEIKGMI